MTVDGWSRCMQFINNRRCFFAASAKAQPPVSCSRQLSNVSIRSQRYLRSLRMPMPIVGVETNPSCTKTSAKLREICDFPSTSVNTFGFIREHFRTFTNTFLHRVDTCVQTKMASK